MTSWALYCQHQDDSGSRRLVRQCFNHVHVQTRGFTKFLVFLKRESLLNPRVRTNFVAFPLERTTGKSLEVQFDFGPRPAFSKQLFGSSRKGTESDRTYFKQFLLVPGIRKREGVQKSIGREVPWKIGVLICHSVTSRPLICPQKEAVSSPDNFATTHMAACILIFYLQLASRPMKWRTLSQSPKEFIPPHSK